MPHDFELPEDLRDSVDVIYLDDTEIDNLETDDPENEEIMDEISELPEDKAKITFNNHSKSVFCVNINSNSTLAVTGGEDDLAYMWELSTGNIILECTGHNDSVTAASFSHDDKYLVTGDMSGLLQVWDVAEKKLAWCYEGGELEWVQWHQNAHVLITGIQSGEIFMFQIPLGNCKVFPTHGSICNTGVLLPNGTQLAAGYDDGSVRIWDLKTINVISQLPPDGNGSVTSLHLSGDGRLLMACGLRVGAVVLKTSDCRPAAVFKTGDAEEVETAAFCTETDLPIVATGSLNGEVCFWDISRQALRHKTLIGYTITNMCWGANAMLFASAVDGVVYVFNGRSGELISSLTGHISAILDIQLSKDSKLLLTASDDTTAKLFEIESGFLPME